MRLERLALRNFQGIEHYTLEPPGGESVDVYGDNGIGKTTLHNAWCWLLYGKSASGQTDFEIKTLVDGEPVHGLEHSVEATLFLASKHERHFSPNEDGVQMVLKKVYKEKWTKKRGAVKPTFTGHTTDHFVDGVPVTKKEYTAKVAKLADEQTFRLLSDVHAFAEALSWQERRQLLVEVCGDIAMEDVIADDEALAPLPQVLGKRSVDEARRVLAARKRELNKALEAIPVRIDEAKRSMPPKGENVSKQLKAAQKRRKELEQSWERPQHNTALDEVEAAIRAEQAKLRQEQDDAVQEGRTRLSAIFNTSNRLEDKLARLQGDMNTVRVKLEANEHARAALRKEWHSINDAAYEGDEVCPTCGQDIPKEQLEEAVAAHNQRQAQRLAEIGENGKALLADAEVMAQKIEEYQKGIAETEAVLAANRSAEKEQKRYVSELEQAAQAIGLSDDHPLVAKRAELLAEEAERKAGAEESARAIAAGIAELDAGIQAMQKKQAGAALRQQLGERIEELKEEERKLAADFETAERELYLLDRYTKTRIKLLDEKINSRFEVARFRLFTEQVNGGVEECCDVMMDGVPYSVLNHGSRVNIGIDIINVLSDHFGISVPIWVDNAESVTKLAPTDAQVVRLVVSAPDKWLRMELPSPVRGQQTLEV